MIRGLGFLLLTITLSTSAIAAVAQPDPAIEFWLVTDAPEGPVALGARMGADEMHRTASLLGRRFMLRELRMTDPGGTESAIATIKRSRRSTFVLLDLDHTDACAMIASLADADEVIVFDARVREQPCPGPALLLRVPASDRDRALRDAQEAGHTRRVDEWHASLQRFGASELNERYHKRTHTSMTGDAWAGWFAAKAAAEASLRLERPTRARLVAPEAPSFDGHKGAALRFDRLGVLRQPVYVIAVSPPAPERVVKEVS